MVRAARARAARRRARRCCSSPTASSRSSTWPTASWCCARAACRRLATVEVHPDDVVALMSGIETDSTARRQLHRLRSLVDQLSEVEPSASLPLIVSAMATALDQDQLCVHLLEPPVRATDGRRCSSAAAAVGLPEPLLAANEALPVGADAAGSVGLAAERRPVVVIEDVRDHPAWAELARPRPTPACGRRGPCPSWRRRGARGDLGLRRAVGPPQPAARAGLALRGPGRRGDRARAPARRGHAAQPHPRDAARRARDAGRPAGRARGHGHGARRAVPGAGRRRRGAARRRRTTARRRAAGAPRRPTAGEPLGRGDRARWPRRPPSLLDGPPALDRARLVGDRVVGAPVVAPQGRLVLTAWWRAPTGIGHDALDLLDDAARSLRLAIEREALEVAHQEADACAGRTRSSATSCPA